MGRLAYAEEEITLFEECKLLVWANSILKVAYDFVSDFMHKHSAGDPPPFEIINFCFVAAGMAIAQRPLNNGPSPTTNRAAYLLEEVLPGEKSDFVKYLHNASAASELALNNPDYQLALFLMFIQHVQYAITGGGLYHAPVIPAGIWSFLWNPVELFLAESPAKLPFQGPFIPVE